MPAKMSAEAEKGLVLKAQHGDRIAFEELVRFHYQGIVRVVFHLCNDTTLAEDATQEAFIKAWMNLQSFQPTSSLRNWLYRIAVNVALDILRRKPETSIDDDQATMIIDQAAGPESALIQKEQAAFLQEAMKTLPAATRSVLVLREYGEFSYQEIATVLDIPMGTVMSRLNYARNRLRDILEKSLMQLENDHV